MKNYANSQLLSSYTRLDLPFPIVSLHMYMLIQDLEEFHYGFDLKRLNNKHEEQQSARLY